MARPLDDMEKALWSRLIATVQPLHHTHQSKAPVPPAATQAVKMALEPARAKAKAPPGSPSSKTAPVKTLPKPLPHNLDGHWDRRIGKGAIIPDAYVDLHGSALHGAYNRLDAALEQAAAQKARVLLLVTGKPRSHDRHSGEGRGAIASVVRDWLAASRHASAIAAVRTAHPRHGGTGALYIILKR